MVGRSSMKNLRGIKVIGVVNLVAALVHLLFWALALSQLVPILQSPMESALATTMGIGVADLLISVPLLLIGSLGLMKGRTLGWMSAQMAHVLYFYSMTFVSVRDFLVGEFSPGTFVFLPFMLFAVWATLYLWKKRFYFFTVS
tara:strand:- start:831 stop:1259 length:429 start_codon:yes stop_codon:yes gene_type:complete